MGKVTRAEVKTHLRRLANLLADELTHVRIVLLDGGQERCTLVLFCQYAGTRCEERVCWIWIRLGIDPPRLPQIRHNACPVGCGQLRGTMYDSQRQRLTLYQCFLTLPSVRCGKV